MQIADNDLRLIKYCRKSLLVDKDEARKKKLSYSPFDVYTNFVYTKNMQSLHAQILKTYGLE